MTRFSFRTAAAAAFAASVWLFGAAGSAQAKDPEKFIAHEWGTFSTFSGSDGKGLKFHPNDRDLPKFVYNRHGGLQVKGGVPDVLVSLETPVLYFYSDRDRTVSVQVDFPKGVMTDWYPQTSRPPTHHIRWDNFKVLAKGDPKFPTGEKSRYYAARETDASPVEIKEAGKTENEKFLFYRGVGDFTMPLTVLGSGGGSYYVKNSDKQAVPAFVFLKVKDGKHYFQKFGKLDAESEVRVTEPTAASTKERLGEMVAKLLIEQGLYEKEAKAMVKTWSSDWFDEEGTRVLYLVAEPVTEKLLPIKIDPKPDQMVRVLVGRHDVLTPERERDIETLVKQLNGQSNPEAKAADKELDRLGRYRWGAQAAAESRLRLNSRR